MNNQVNPNDLTKHAETLKEKLQEAYASIEQSVFTGKSGDDDASVEVKMTGRHEVTEVNIAKGLMHALLEGASIDDAQLEQMCSVLGQVVMFAINDSVKKVGDMSRQKFSALAADMQLDNMDSAE